MSEGNKPPKNQEKKNFKIGETRAKQKKQDPLAIRFISPQVIPWGISLLFIYVIMVFLTGSWHESLITQIIASIRLLILTLGLFYTFIGILGLIYHPEDKYKAIPVWIRRKYKQITEKK